jgi:hypothetical protein
MSVSTKCPFAAPITVGRASCRLAEEVVRRGGSEYDCRSVPEHARCSALFASLKRYGLEAFGADDDPTATPHSVLVKVQTGGLSGLARLLGRSGQEGIADIATLVAEVEARYGGIDQVPYRDLAGDMLDCRLERRGRRRSR